MPREVLRTSATKNSRHSWFGSLSKFGHLLEKIALWLCRTPEQLSIWWHIPDDSGLCADACTSANFHMAGDRGLSAQANKIPDLC